ncbi:hypothetical protein KUL42_17460 [Alteromonas sp. KUL42]|uniref:hypothetical protein n=1 Tax=Alteromonas sp. KUL42 TaxID=2480797 RepID=UPI00079AE703|nr:hypothetical protein [Alteromonas sp. KUL42]KXJ60278.1 MAG: hypothetical protein AXW14_13115 [Alteromonas sp. Nap_26]TAP36761.1 hypothetical protein EYR97_08615 [Alteromonas sp. KUL42]GEA06985.1 hypothetical protein KUL42_17460 [Alteromonas sp. KUL42]
MKIILRLVLILTLLAAAIASYSAGISSGVFIFIVLGFLFEAGFWSGLFPTSRRGKKVNIG